MIFFTLIMTAKSYSQICCILNVLKFLTVRCTAIQTLRRAGVATEQIMKLTGHKCIESLIKSYDHTDNGAKVDMASTIGYAAQISRGNISKVEGMIL